MTTPPQDRQAIQTVVCRFDQEVIKEAIIRELERNGQVYFVHNRIFDIEKVADRIKNILPQLKERVVIAHGQMPGHELEQKMHDFVNRKYDILISTNIIESGLDIPRVNTIFVHNADDFGLSDLHQLRGRVGRYKYQAYAYFIIPPDAVIGSDARKRLKAIEEFNELGSGFKIAMRDMEIRGIGNILGKEQHGHIAAVGYELYCRLLEKAVKQIKGTKEPHQIKDNFMRVTPEEQSIDDGAVEIKEKPANPSDSESSGQGCFFGEGRTCDINLKIDAFLPTDYIASEKHRLEIYRRLSMATDESVISVIYKEVKDRFGSPLPQSAENLFKLIRLKIKLSDRGILSIVQAEDSLQTKYTKNVLIIIKMGTEDSDTAIRRYEAMEWRSTAKEWIKMMRERYPDIIRVIDEQTIHLNLPLKSSAERDKLVLEHLMKMF
jgi:transcription-repair coupling factor (superfamily II helicase)